METFLNCFKPLCTTLQLETKDCGMYRILGRVDVWFMSYQKVGADFIDEDLSML